MIERDKDEVSVALEASRDEVHQSIRVIHALVKFCDMKDKQFLYLQLIRIDNINPFLNLIQSFSSKQLIDRLPPSMYFYIFEKEVDSDEELFSEKLTQSKNFLDRLTTDNIEVRQYVKSKYIKKRSKKFISNQVNRIIITHFIMDVNRMIRLQERLLRLHLHRLLETNGLHKGLKAPHLQK